MLKQIPNSPGTNMLDLGVWRSLQAQTKILGYHKRQDPDAIANTVMQAWKGWINLEKIYRRWELVLSLIPLDNGGEKYVDAFCRKLISDPTANSDFTNNDLIIAQIKEKIVEEGKDNLPPRENNKMETFVSTSDITLLHPTKSTTGTTSHPKNGKHEKKLEVQHQKIKRKHRSTKETDLMKKKSRLLMQKQRYSSDLNRSD